MFEWSIINCLISQGAKIGLYTNEDVKISDDMKVLHPTVFVSIPWVFNKIYANMLKNLEESIFGGMINSAIKNKLQNL